MDAIIAVGYRVNSYQATQFRIWATSVLKEFIIKGYALDDERLKQGKHFGKDYFDDLLERIREIRRELSSLFDGMMQALYKLEGSRLRIEVLETPKMREFMEAHAAALDSSFQKVEMTDTMRRRLQRSDYVFSGMKTFHELNEAFPSLLDENGERKTFERFLNDVRKIDETYNSNYLRAEYNFVQASAEMAAK